MHYFELHFQKLIAATKGWKDDELGAYVRLLIEQFDRGYIPEDPKELSRLITTFRKNWPLLKKKFTEPSEPGQLRNTFMCGIREDALERSAKNSVAGKIGAAEKKRLKSERLANAKANDEAGAKQPHKRGLSQPVTSNQKPILELTSEGESVNTRADLSKSNLYREPRVPSLEEVQREFIRQRGTVEMANQFYETNDSTGWFFKGSPIVKFSSLVAGYVRNWKQNEQERQTSGQKAEPSVAEQIRLARQKQNQQ